MLRYIAYNSINKQSWDACIAASVNALPYAYSWYLDITTENSWDAIVIDDYKAVMPLPVKKRLGIKKIYQPFFSQQLGLFYTDAKYMKQLEACVKAIPSGLLKARLHLNTQNEFNTTEIGITSHIDLKNKYDIIYHNYGSAVKKNLKSAIHNTLEVNSGLATFEFIQFVKTYVGDKASEVKAGDFKRLQTLIESCLQNKKGFILAAKEADRVLGTVFILHSDHYLIYLIAASSPAGRKKQAMTFLIDHILKTYAGTQNIFDFEGSRIPGIANFYKNFGAREAYFPVIQK